jgi:flagella basal body P-ring formation protein FlgA
MNRLKALIALFLFLASFQSNCLAKHFDSEYIRQFAKAFIENNVPIPAKGKLVVTPASIDPRIKIKSCSTPLQANIPEKTTGRNVNLKISCVSSTPWQFFLPVKVITSIPVVVAATRLSKGSVIDRSNVVVELKDIYKIRGETLDKIEDIIGARSKRSMSKGTNISKTNTCVVCKGQNVTIVAKSANFNIKTAGVALQNASFGEQVKVKNTRSGRTITAQVKTINQVIINL